MSVDQPILEPFLIAFGIKHTEEIELDGVVGLLTRGYASKFNVVDQDGEHQVPGSFADIDDTWGRQAKPLVLYNHGFDPVLTTSPIGWGVKYSVDAEGLSAECFIPRDPQPPLADPARRAKYAQVYAGIKARRISGYSVGGVFKRAGKALLQWSMTELTITPTPCLTVATFALGQKAIKALYDQPDFAQVQASLPMPDWSHIMNVAQTHNDPQLHDFLLTTYPTHDQGDHSAQDCTICGAKRGYKADTFPDGDFLVVDADGSQHLQVKKNGTPDHGLMGGAYAALTSNHRGQPYAGDDKSSALRKLKALYTSEQMDWPGEAGGKASLCAACKSQGAGCKACTCANCNDDDPDTICLCEGLDADADDGAKAVADAVATLRIFTKGVKAGRQFSRANLDKFATIITMLQELTNLQKQDNDGDEADEASETPAPGEKGD